MNVTIALRVRNRNWLVLGLLLLTGLVFFQVQGFQFLDWDDNLLLTDNPWVQVHSWTELWRVWDPTPVWNKLHPEFFPLRDLGYALIHWLWGLHPRAYHLLNLCFHLANVVLIAVIASRLLRSNNGGLLTALFFALHPIHVEPVVWISGFKELSMTFFVLLSLWCFLRYLEHIQQRWAWSALLCALGAALCKHVGVLTPLFWLLLVCFFPISLKLESSVAAKDLEESDDATSSDAVAGESEVSSRRVLWLRWWPVGAGLVMGLIVGVWSLHIGKMNLLIHDITHVSRQYSPLVLQPLVQWDNLRRLLVPIGLQPIYDPPTWEGWFSGSAITALFCCLGILWLVWLAWQRQVRVLVFAVGWYVIGWLPFMTFQVGTQLTTDRYLYLPSFGFCLCLAWGVLWLEKKRQGWGWIITGVVALVYAVLLLRALPMWHSPQTFWSGFVQKAPRQSHALAGMASLQMRQKNFKQAIAYNQLFLKLYSPHPDRMADLSVAYLSVGQPEKGLQVVKEGLRLFPNSGRIYNVAGMVMVRGGRTDRAVALFARATQLEPRLFQAHLNLLRSLMDTRQTTQAMQHTQRLLRQPLPGSVRQQILQIVNPK